MRYLYELVNQMPPFVRNRHHHQHQIFIRLIKQHIYNTDDLWHKEIIGSVSMDYVCHDPTKLDSCLVEIIQTNKTITIGAYMGKNSDQPTKFNAWKEPPIVSEVI